MSALKGDPITQNDGMVEWRNDGMAENRPNPKRWNDRKSPQTLKDGIFSKIKNVCV